MAYVITSNLLLSYMHHTSMTWLNLRLRHVIKAAPLVMKLLKPTTTDKCLPIIYLSKINFNRHAQNQIKIGIKLFLLTYVLMYIWFILFFYFSLNRRSWRNEGINLTSVTIYQRELTINKLLEYLHYSNSISYGSHWKKI